MAAPENYGPDAFNLPARARLGLDLQPAAREEERGSDGLLEFLGLFRQRKLLIASVTALGALLGFGITLPKPAIYGAKGTLEVQVFNENFLGIGQLDPQAGSYTPTEANIRTHVQILRSNALRREVVAKLERESIPSLPPAPSGWAHAIRSYGLEKILGRAGQNPVDAMRSGIRTAASSLVVRPVAGARIIEISCRSTHPEIGANFVNALMNQFIEQNLSVRLKSLQRTNQWLTAQASELKARLDKSEEQLQSYLRAHGGALATAGDADVLMQTRIQQLERDRGALRADRVARQSIFQNAASASLDQLALSPEGAPLKPLYAKAEQLRRDLAELNKTLTPAHYKVKQTEAAIAEADAEVAREREAILLRLRRDNEEAQRKENVQAAALEGELRRIGSRADRFGDYHLMKRQVENDRQLYQAMLANMNHAGLASAVPANNLQVIDPAEPSGAPETVTATMNVALGASTGLLASLGCCVLLRRSNRRVRTPGDAPNLLRIPELGVIPSSSSREKRRLLQPLSLDGGSDSQRVELVTWRQKPSWAAQSFRDTLASLVSPIVNGSHPRLLVVTSPNPKEGKSTVSSNLAIALSEINRRVLLVDADLRSPRLHTIFNLPNSWGLSDLVQEKTPVEQYPLEALMRPTEVPGVYLLPSGPPASVLSPILYSARLQTILQRLRKEFDYVIVDTAPVLPCSDARVIGRLADGVIVVLRSNSTDRASAVSACRRLIQDGIQILGTMLNDWDYKKQPSPYGLGESYGSYGKYFDSARG